MAGRRNILLSIAVRIVVSLGLLAVAAGVFAALARSRPTAARTPMARIAPQVLVMEARPFQVRRQWDAFGTAEAMDSADVPARVTATVVQIPPGILAGAVVDRGQLLVQLDDSDFLRQEEIATEAIADLQAQMERLAIEEEGWKERLRLAGEQVKLAQAEYERVVDARERNVAKEREVDQAQQALLEAIRGRVAAREEHDKLPARRTSLQAQLRAQQAQQALARQNVERCSIVSPLSGILESVDVEVGENLAAGPVSYTHLTLPTN